MPPCGPPISEPEMGGRGDVAARHESGCLLDMGGGKGFAQRREGGELLSFFCYLGGTNAPLWSPHFKTRNGGTRCRGGGGEDIGD